MIEDKLRLIMQLALWSERSLLNNAQDVNNIVEPNTINQIINLKDNVFF